MKQAAIFLLYHLREQRFNKFLITMTGAALSSYGISGLHYKPTLSNLGASSDAYVFWTLSYGICFENHTRGLLIDPFHAKIQLLVR